MDILLYLTELLQTRKMVGIVGLGTLYKKKSPGKYDASQHAFIPPSYSLAFTTELKEQEELASFISQRRNISIESSNYFIGEFAEQIQAKLHDHQEADLEPIGKLKLVDGEIIFEPEAESNFGFEFYGLPTLTELQQPGTEERNQEDLAQIEEENRLEEENPGNETTDFGETAEEMAGGAAVEEENRESDEQPVHEEITEVAPVGTSQNQETAAEQTDEAAAEEENDGAQIHEEIAEVHPFNPSQDEVAAPAQESTPETAAAPTEGMETVVPVQEAAAEQLASQEEKVREPITVYEAPAIETAEVADQQAEEEAPIAQHTAVYTEEEEPKKGMPFFMKFLIILLAIIALGAIAYFINPAFFNRYLKKNFEGAHDQNVPSAPLDTLKNHADTAKKDSLAKNNALVTLTKDSTAIDSNVMVYEVLVASVKSDKMADKIIANLATRNIKGKKVILSKTRINISAGTFTEPKLAKKYEDSLRKILHDKGIYTQPIKPKKQKQ